MRPPRKVTALLLVRVAIAIVQGVPYVLERFARSYLGNPWDYTNGIGAKSCVSSLSFT
jgi:hypothetical protein